MTILNREDLQKIVVPSFKQTLVCLFLAMVILIGSNADRLLQSFAGYIPSSGIRTGLNGVLHTVSRLAGANTAVLVLFWAMVGLVVYGISWAVLNALVHTYNEAVIETQFANRGSWLEQLSPGLLQLFFGVCTIIFTLLSGWVIAELVRNFALSLLHWTPPQLFKESVQTLLLALDLYVWWVLLRLTFYVE